MIWNTYKKSRMTLLILFCNFDVIIFYVIVTERKQEQKSGFEFGAQIPQGPCGEDPPLSSFFSHKEVSLRLKGARWCDAFSPRATALQMDRKTSTKTRPPSRHGASGVSRRAFDSMADRGFGLSLSHWLSAGFGSQSASAEIHTLGLFHVFVFPFVFFENVLKCAVRFATFNPFDPRTEPSLERPRVL